MYIYIVDWGSIVYSYHRTLNGAKNRIESILKDNDFQNIEMSDADEYGHVTVTATHRFPKYDIITMIIKHPLED